MRTIRRFNIKGKTKPADGAGVAPDTFIDPKGESGQWLVIERISVRAPQATQSHFGLYEGEKDLPNLLEYTAFAENNVADEASPIVVDAGIRLVLAWDGLDPTNVGAYRLQCRIDDPRDTGSSQPDAGGPYPARSGPGVG